MTNARRIERRLSAVCLLALGCAGPPPARIDAPAPAPAPVLAFDGEAAMQRLRWLMDRPRTLGLQTRTQSVDALAGALEEHGAIVDRIEHEAADPATGTAYRLVNLVAHLRPDAPRTFVLGSHFDTRPWADEESDAAAHTEPVPGANDGSSGVAVILELVPRLIEELPPEVGITVVFFDGEELGRPEHGGYCMGSRHVGARVRAGLHPRLSCASFGIVLDMVGDADLHLQPEPSSLRYHPELTARIWATGRQIADGVFDDRPRQAEIIDDHKFLSEAGIPSVLIIDHDYDAWHTRADTVDRVSTRSLEIVGRTVLSAVVDHWRGVPPAGDCEAFRPTDRG